MKNEAKAIYDYLLDLYRASEGCAKNNKNWKVYPSSTLKSNLCFAFNYADINYYKDGYYRFKLMSIDLKNKQHERISLRIFIDENFNNIEFREIFEDTGEDVISFIMKLDTELITNYRNKRSMLMELFNKYADREAQINA